MVDFDELTNFSCTPSLNRSQEVRHKALEDVYRLLQLPPHCCHHWREDLLLPWRVESWLTEHGTDPADNEAHWRSWHWYIVLIFFFLCWMFLCPFFIGDENFQRLEDHITKQGFWYWQTCYYFDFPNFCILVWQI